MKKIWSKIRKIFASIGVALFTFGTRVFAFDPTKVTPLYGVEPIEEIKPKPSLWEQILPIIKLVFIPLLLLIGLIIYWKKSKAEKKKKIYISVGIILLGVVIYGIISWIEYANFIM